MNNIAGLEIYRRFLDETAQTRLAAVIDTKPWSHAINRRTQHYGWRYSYDRRQLGPADRLPFPAWIRILGDRLEPAFGESPDQAIVNEYRPGQGIGAHIDHPGNFGPIIASISLLSSATMIFSRAGRVENVVLEPGALLVMSGEARYKWTHAIPTHAERRLSVTFRVAQLSL